MNPFLGRNDKQKGKKKFGGEKFGIGNKVATLPLAIIFT